MEPQNPTASAGAKRRQKVRIDPVLGGQAGFANMQYSARLHVTQQRGIFPANGLIQYRCREGD